MVNSVKHLKINKDEDLMGREAAGLVIRSLKPNARTVSVEYEDHIRDGMK